MSVYIKNRPAAPLFIEWNSFFELYIVVTISHLHTEKEKADEKHDIPPRINKNIESGIF